MKIVNYALALGVITLCLSFGTVRGLAQPGQQGFGGFGGGNFDMSQIQKMIMDNMREQFDVSDDAEWNVISDKLQKVIDARMQVGFGGGMGMAAMFRPPGNAGQQPGGGQGGGRRGGMFGGAPDPEADALQKAIDAKAPPAELKAVVARFVEARKQKQAKLEQAQSELRKLLSVRQEAVAYSLGLL